MPSYDEIRAYADAELARRAERKRVEQGQKQAELSKARELFAHPGWQLLVDRLVSQRENAQLRVERAQKLFLSGATDGAVEMAAARRDGLQAQAIVATLDGVLTLAKEYADVEPAAG